MKTNVRILTAPAEGNSKNDPKRMTQVFFYWVGLSPDQVPSSFVFDDKITVEIRPRQRNTATIVVNLNVNNVVTDSQYRETVRSLMGSRFGRFVCSRVRSHRRRNINAELPYVKPRRFDAIVNRIILQMIAAHQVAKSRPALQQTEHLATT